MHVTNIRDFSHVHVDYGAFRNPRVMHVEFLLKSTCNAYALQENITLNARFSFLARAMHAPKRDSRVMDIFPPHAAHVVVSGQ